MPGQEEVGSIVYQVEMEIDPLLQGGRAANRVIGQLDSTASTAGKTFKTLDTQLSSTARAVSAASGSSKRLGGSFQQIGYQIQDFVVQVQGGQSAMVAFGQQGSQLAGAFGPGGAILGAVIALASALAGPLLASLGSSSNKMADLQSAAESLNKIVVINSQGVAALSNDYARLAATNAALATQLRDAAVARYAAEVENARKAVSNIAEEQTSWWRSLSGGVASVTAAGNALDTLSVTTDNFKEAINQAEGAGTAFRSSTQTLLSTVAMMADKFDISEQSAFTLVKQLNELAKNPTSDNVTRISQSIAGMKSTTDEGRLALVNFRDELTKAGASAAQAEQAVKDLEASIGRMKTEAQAANFDSLTKGLKQQLIGLKQGKQAAIEYAIAQQDLTEEQKNEAIELSRQVSSAEAAAEAKKKAENQSKRSASVSDAAATALSRQSAAIDRLNTGYADGSLELAKYDAVKALGSQATQKQIAEAERNSEAEWKLQKAKAAVAQSERDKQSAQSNFTGLQGVASPVAAVDNQFQQQMDQLNQYAQLYPQKIAEVEAVRASIEGQYRKKRQAAQWQEFGNMGLGYEILTSAVDSFGQSASSSLSGVITGTQSASDAMRGLANTVLSSVIQAFVEMGLQQVRAAIMGTAAQEAGIAAVTSAQVAGTATTTAVSTAAAAATTAAWTPAAIVASIGSFGGAAAIGVGAVLGALAMGVAGKRKNGGPVASGSMYQVGEGGLPEIYQASTGKQYMIPGDNGKVISNKDMQGGGGMPNVVFNVYDQSGGSKAYDYQASMAGDTLTVTAFIADMDNGGPMSQSVTRNHQAPRKATQ
ncbi:phage tail tape measure protein [Serratia marcescens]|nr:phage tail tape measure protein [Serratia marcescens]